MLDVVVLNYNDANETINHLNSIKDIQSIDHIVVVDNKSTDDSYKILLQYANNKIDVIQSDKNGGYGYGNNFGARYLMEKYHSSYIAIANPDVRYTEKCITTCVKFLKRNPEYTIVAPQMLSIDGKRVNSIWNIPDWKDYLLFSVKLLGRGHRLEVPTIQKKEKVIYVDCDCVAGSLLILNANAFNQIGMYDENVFLYCEETILGIRNKNKGYRSALLPDYTFIHAHSASINKSIQSRYKQMKIQWKSRLYVLQTYYGLSKLQMTFATAVSKVSLLEEMLRALKGKLSGH
jgi:GT2 family glycosyltransferase